MFENNNLKLLYLKILKHIKLELNNYLTIKMVLNILDEPP